TLRINGEDRNVDAPGDMPLLWVLRDLIGLTGTKFGCGIAQCGACTVHLDGKPTRSCVLPVSAVGNRPITTIQGVGATPSGALALRWPVPCGKVRSCRVAGEGSQVLTGRAQLDSRGQSWRWVQDLRIRRSVEPNLRVPSGLWALRILRGERCSKVVLQSAVHF